MYLCPVLNETEFRRQILLKIADIKQHTPELTEQATGQPDTLKLTVSFHNCFATVPKISPCSLNVKIVQHWMV